MRMTVLASGSKGNSTVISSSRTRVLVDCGLSCRELLRRMALTGEDPRTLDAILITHEHIDHVSGLPVLARKLGIPVYFTEPTHRAWVRMMTPRTTMSYAQWLDHLQAQKLARSRGDRRRVYGGCTCVDALAGRRRRNQAPQIPPHGRTRTRRLLARTRRKSQGRPHISTLARVLPTRRGFTVGDLAVSAFTTPHDAADPCGFVFEADGVRMAVATDLGYIPPNVKAALRSVDAMLLESNHDIEMLRDGPYPWSVKQRVLSPRRPSLQRRHRRLPHPRLRRRRAMDRARAHLGVQ